MTLSQNSGYKKKKKQQENYFNLRLDKHSQWEIQQTAIAMKELIGKPEQEIQEGL